MALFTKMWAECREATKDSLDPKLVTERLSSPCLSLKGQGDRNLVRELCARPPNGSCDYVPGLCGQGARETETDLTLLLPSSPLPMPPIGSTNEDSTGSRGQGAGGAVHTSQPPGHRAE